ncbi:hypothetical protein J1N35_001262 [Gossypium stocksii]|uniref:Proteasomal ATPase second OB domain-containing protein n=1 Tax=Gossypium stocksii TaxID=47602 RepID=A0A9D3WJT0_9ROSI|nr:hypothetical protein J1N35_001262 [Gossypium stocksii]
MALTRRTRNLSRRHPARVGRNSVTPLSKCKLQLLKLEQIKGYLLMEEEFVVDQERLKPQEEKAEEGRSKVDDLRGSSMSVGNLEELIDENHAIVSSLVGPEYYVGILSFVDKDQLEPRCAILMHNKKFMLGYFCSQVLSVVGLLQDDIDPMVSVMKVEKAPLESYADIGGLDAQIQEIKEVVELPLTHPELYEDIDGFDSRGDVKVILATDQIESIDPALLCTGLGRLNFPYLTSKQESVFSRMTLADDVNLEEFVMTKDEFSGADRKALCIEAGLLTLRERCKKEEEQEIKERSFAKAKGWSDCQLVCCGNAGKVSSQYSVHISFSLTLLVPDIST